MDESEIEKITSKLSPEEAKLLKKKLSKKTGYVKKGVYREKKNKVRYFNPDEWEKLIEKCNDNLSKYFWFLYLTGMRYKEAKNVRKDHIDWKNRTIIVFTPKGGVQRYVSFSSFAKKKFRHYFEESDTIGFPTIQSLIRTLKKYSYQLGFPYAQDISVHNIRKSHENALLTLDLNEKKITRHMGHNIKTAEEHYNSSQFIKSPDQKRKLEKWFGDIFG